ncbi:calcium-binding protein [Roseibium sp. Sym1]|uniref:calcium-binding protein n=1 Tax=Roseibium sp. Sym1 TaxID=3016006 RepID=UPI0022B5933B|nr:calcium-binding protein [Roseibium sp. Sym1]
MTYSANDILPDEQKNSFEAVGILPLGPAFESGEEDTPPVELHQPIYPDHDLTDDEEQVTFQQMSTVVSGDYGRGTTRSDNSPGTAGSLSFAAVPEDDGLTPGQPLPLGPVIASNQVDAVVFGDYGRGTTRSDNSPGTAGSLSFTAVPEDDGLTPVQPLPLEPAFASNQVGEDTFGQMRQTNTEVTSPETTTVLMSTTAISSGDSFYSTNQWSVLEGLGLTDLATYNLDGGPTLSQYGEGGDFEARPFGEVLTETKWHYAAGGFYDKMKLISDGVLVTGADDLKIDALEGKHTVYYNEWWGSGSHHYTNHHIYTAIDASNASGHVTYTGASDTYWQGETHLTSKTYGFQNIFKGGDFGNKITGGGHSDILIGGEGNDKIFGVGGNNIIYGVGGDNRIDGGDGGSTIFGGTGNDFILTGKGSNTVVLGNGDNWVVVNQNNLDGTSDANKIVLGSGNDTVVIGNIPPSKTTVTSSMSEWQMGLVTDTGIDVGGDFAGWASQALGAANPLWGMVLTAGKDLISALVGGTPSEVVQTTDYSVFEATEITNFNPLTDRLLFPMNSEGSNNLAIRTEANGHDLTIYDYNTMDVLAFIDFASAEEIFGTSGSLSAAEKKAFGESMLSSVLFMDADGLTLGGGQDVNHFSVNASDIDTLGSFSDDIGAGKYMFAGAWTGNYMFGDSSTGSYMGSQLNDILFGFDVTGNSINAGTGGGAKFYGFGGNNLFATGTGHNLVFGGTGEDTVTYEYALGGIYVDMTDLTIDPDNKDHGMHFTVTQDLAGYHADFLWNVENIIGSIYDDTIIGNDEDNTFVSTGGNNTWSGTGGSNTFVLNGGTTTITDFNYGSDTIQIQKSAYVDGNVNYQANLKWIEGDDAWMLYDLKNFDDTNPQALVTLDKNDGFDGPVELELVTHDGSVRSFLPGTWTADHLGIDLVV